MLVRAVDAILGTHTAGSGPPWRLRSPAPAAPLARAGAVGHRDRQKPSELRLTRTADARARRALETELFGKRILVTSRDDWPVAEAVAGYRSQDDAEGGFRQLRTPRWSRSP